MCEIVTKICFRQPNSNLSFYLFSFYLLYLNQSFRSCQLLFSLLFKTFPFLVESQCTPLHHILLPHSTGICHLNLPCAQTNTKSNSIIYVVNRNKGILIIEAHKGSSVSNSYDFIPPPLSPCTLDQFIQPQLKHIMNKRWIPEVMQPTTQNKHKTSLNLTSSCCCCCCCWQANDHAIAGWSSNDATISVGPPNDWNNSKCSQHIKQPIDRL